MKNKAVSPIVATTLLLVFSIALSAIIVNWITPIANNNLEKSDHEDDTRTYCATARADIVSVSIYDTNKTTISIQNVGDADINLTDAYIYNQDYQSCKLSIDDSNLEVGDFAIATNNTCGIISTCDDFLFVDVSTNCKNVIIRYNGVLTPTSDDGCKL
ncbi:hypothetical protein GQ473_02215 [archaeon]|nr:hypothetical protein [archaeon]